MHDDEGQYESRYHERHVPDGDPENPPSGFSSALYERVGLYVRNEPEPCVGFAEFRRDLIEAESEKQRNDNPDYVENRRGGSESRRKTRGHFVVQFRRCHDRIVGRSYSGRVFYGTRSARRFANSGGRGVGRRRGYDVGRVLFHVRGVRSARRRRSAARRASGGNDGPDGTDVRTLAYGSGRSGGSAQGHGAGVRGRPARGFGVGVGHSGERDRENRREAQGVFFKFHPNRRVKWITDPSYHFESSLANFLQSVSSSRLSFSFSRMADAKR